MVTANKYRLIRDLKHKNWKYVVQYSHHITSNIPSISKYKEHRNTHTTYIMYTTAPHPDTASLSTALRRA